MTRVHCTCSGLKTWTSDTMIPDSSTVPQAVHTESALKIESNSTVVFKFMGTSIRVQRVTPVMYCQSWMWMENKAIENQLTE